MINRIIYSLDWEAKAIIIAKNATQGQDCIFRIELLEDSPKGIKKGMSAITWKNNIILIK